MQPTASSTEKAWGADRRRNSWPRHGHNNSNRTLFGGLLEELAWHGFVAFREVGGGSRVLARRLERSSARAAGAAPESVFSGQGRSTPASIRRGLVQEEFQTASFRLSTCCWPWQGDWRCGASASQSGIVRRHTGGDRMRARQPDVDVRPPRAPKKYLETIGRRGQGKLDPVIGRDEEIRRTIPDLRPGRTIGTPGVIGDGCGKTAIVEGGPTLVNE